MPAPTNLNLPMSVRVVSLEAWHQKLKDMDVLNGANPWEDWRRIKNDLAAKQQIGILKEMVWSVPATER